MLLARSYGFARSSAPPFLLGAGIAALLVLSFAGASLTFSPARTVLSKPGFNELRLHPVPPPAKVLGRLA